MRFKAFASAIALLISAGHASSGSVGSCENSSLRHILPHLSPDAYVSFSNGAIRIADVYVDANLASSGVIAVLHPRQSDLQGAGFYEACSVVYSSRSASPYFGQVFLRRAKAQYDPQAGLIVSIPTRYDFADRNSETGTVVLTINQNLGAVDVKER